LRFSPYFAHVEAGPELSDAMADYFYCHYSWRDLMATREGRSRGRSKKASRSRTDAIALLKADHRQVEGWFSAFEKTRSDRRKQDLATKICTALKVHTKIEEEIFYPEFLRVAGDEDIHHEAIVEHDGAKKLISEIEAATPADDYFDAKVSVLSEMIKHHVKEEEQPGGMFAKARQSQMDLRELRARLAARKKELMNSSGSRGGMRSAIGRVVGRESRL
jgi:hemerythrin superfamily protein